MKKLLPLAAFAALAAGTTILSPAAAQFSVAISVNFAPPALPIYDQPPIPVPDYIWMPGYWAWDSYVQDYFWIPGTWMQAPRPGLLWTPAWWGWQGGAYLFHEGYWGPHVGFYGGVPYGFGYTGSGYQGAYWNGAHVYYNRSVTNITNVRVTNVYNQTVIVNHITNVGYNGGPGGIQARPSSIEQVAMHEPHLAPTPLQKQHVQAAQANRQFFASANHGRPAIAATARPAIFSGPGVVPTRQAVGYRPQGTPSAKSGGVPALDSQARRPRPKPQDNSANQPPLQPDAFQDRQLPAQGSRQQIAPEHDQRSSPPSYMIEHRSQPAPANQEGSDTEGFRPPARQDAAAYHSPSPPPKMTAHPATQPHHPPPVRPHPPGPQHPHPQGRGHPKPPHPDDRHG